MSCYSCGKGVGLYEPTAAKWYRAVAEQGHKDAQFELGRCYELGKGVGQSYAEAAKWYRKAAEQGQVAAQKD